MRRLPRTRSSRRRRIPVGAAAAVGALAVFAAPAAPGYRFYGAAEGVVVPGSAGAIRWDAEEWADGGTLRWFLAQDSGWTEPWEDEDGPRDPPFASALDARPYLERALEAWSDLASADIRWRSGSARTIPANEADGWNAVGVSEAVAEAGALAWAAVWIWRPSEAQDWKIYECDIELAPGSAAALREEGAAGLATLIHEFGHCIGLDHAAEHAVYAGLWDFDSGVWGEAPKMSYGWHLSNALLVDDRVGASLLRPAAGWVSSTGAVSGRVTTSGGPARFVTVRSARLVGGEAVPGPQAFTDAAGRFELEGLAPGDYLLRAGSFVNGLAHPELLMAGASGDARDGSHLAPVSVTAGRTTRGVEITLAPNREGSNWVE